MGAIQSSINQALSVGAFLASQSPQLKERAERIVGVKKLEKAQAVQTQRVSDIEEARANIESDAAVLTDEGVEYRFTPEQELELKGLDVEESSLKKEQAATAAEKYKIDPTREHYFEKVESNIPVLQEEQRQQKAQEWQSKKEAAQKAERAKKDRRNERDRINRAVERALRKREAQEALTNRRQEMGDKMLIGGVEFGSEHPLYKKVQEQLQKEGQ